MEQFQETTDALAEPNEGLPAQWWNTYRSAYDWPPFVPDETRQALDGKEGELLAPYQAYLARVGQVGNEAVKYWAYTRLLVRYDLAMAVRADRMLRVASEAHCRYASDDKDCRYNEWLFVHTAELLTPPAA